jgi:hypothetical protein
MVTMVLETEALPEAALPVDALAAQLRLPDGWDTVPGQRDRLIARLRAAVVALERRLGLVTVTRAVTQIASGGAARVPLAVGPAVELVSVERVRGGQVTGIEGVRLEEETPGAVLVLPSAPAADARLRIVLRAGFGAWADVPAPLAQAALLEAETLETGEPHAAPVAALIGPWRSRRLGVRA